MLLENKNNRIAIFHNLPDGGGLRMVRQIIKKYQNKYEIDLYTISDLKQRKILGVNNIIKCVKPWKGFFLRNIWVMFILPRFHKKLADKINNSYRKILVTHDYFTKSPYLLKYLKIYNVYLCQETQREFYESWKVHAPKLKQKIANIFRLPIKYIDKRNVSFANIIICNSKFSKKNIKKAYGRRGFVVYPGVDEKFFCPDNSKKDNTILCIGGINPVKDQVFLVSSLKPLIDKYKLILVGQGENEYIEKVLSQVGNRSNISILNNISETELRSLYRRSMVTCISAYKEPFGLSSLESQSCGTPVVSVNDGGSVETIINGKTGYLVKKDAEKFLNKILLAVKNNNKMGKMARKHILSKWTWNKTLKQIDKYI